MPKSNEELFRDSLIDALERELIGPSLPPPGNDNLPAEKHQETLQESPTQRYSAGVLFPQRQAISEHDDQNEPSSNANEVSMANEVLDQPVVDPAKPEKQANVSGDQLTDAYDETVRLANEFYPSATGLSCLCSDQTRELKINVSAARYKSNEATYTKEVDGKVVSYSRSEWQRQEIEIPEFVLQFPPRKHVQPWQRELSEDLAIKAMFRYQKDGKVLLTLSLINTHINEGEGHIRAAKCFFQVSISATGEGAFLEYNVLPQCDVDRDDDDPDVQEDSALELLYRKRRAFAVGHGCSVDWGKEHNGAVSSLKTVAVPRVKVPPVEPRGVGGDELSMFILSGAESEVSPDKVPSILLPLTSDYQKWIDEQEASINTLPIELQKTGQRNIDACKMCLSRIRNGIDLLRSDSILLQAFMLANRVILMQQHHSRRSKRSTDEPLLPLPHSYRPQNTNEGRWRTFQLAFILMNLSSLRRNKDGVENPDRDLVDLIWFPTGGGKTEAYLGLAATDIFLRRLLNPDNAGCTVLMRYTLRLLTTQQFQRASSMICACEVIRRGQPDSLGATPISIGLWVGASLTPLYRADAIKSLNKLAKPGTQAANDFQVLKCPWCGTALDEPENLGYRAGGRPKSVLFVCPERSCSFATPQNRLPIAVIDDDIYEVPPTLIIGTVDKFAMLTWREQAGRIFGLGAEGTNDPPDLIIQDELHLISGPLGSVVGMYESAIELLCSWKGRKPKIVASTATIRRAWHQCRALYDRPTSQFPPQGLDVSDSFFAKENQNAPGRYYAGVFATAAPSFVTAMVRTIGGLLHASKALPLPANAPEATRDPYWTILQYFSSLRELGHAATLVAADIPEYMFSINSRAATPKQNRRWLGPPIELTSRRTADEIPEILEKLGNRYPQISKNPADKPLDTLLATNMISVGVDIDRLGLMVVVGQPKTTSEYIQASSRVGRSKVAPGLIVTMYNPGKPRDRSHYEHFRAYHEAFYKHVEPTSVTPFSLPVLERALHGVLIILVRHLLSAVDPTDFDDSSSNFKSLINKLEQRCKSIDPEHSVALTSKLNALINRWRHVNPKKWGGFTVDRDTLTLIHPAGKDIDEVTGDFLGWPTPTSMRNVDVECQVGVIARYGE